MSVFDEIPGMKEVAKHLASTITNEGWHSFSFKIKADGITVNVDDIVFQPAERQYSIQPCFNDCFGDGLHNAHYHEIGGNDMIKKI